MNISTIITAAAVALFATAASAQAPQQVAVSYADLNLASAAGQEVLGHRIDAAARTVCGVDSDERMLAITTAAKNCHKAAVARTKFVIASAYAPVLASR
jgi:UrcA family protein